MARLKESDRGALKHSGTDARIEVQGRVATIRNQIEALQEDVARHKREIASAKSGIAERTRLALSYECLLNPGGTLTAKGAFTINSDDGLSVTGATLITRRLPDGFDPPRSAKAE